MRSTVQRIVATITTPTGTASMMAKFSMLTMATLISQLSRKASLQYVKADRGFYYFDENGYQKTGKISNVECDDDDYNFYFNNKEGKKDQGYKGEKDDYLYFNGKRLEADDDYRLYYYNGDIYLTNNKGKIQTSTKGKELMRKVQPFTVRNSNRLHL